MSELEKDELQQLINGLNKKRSRRPPQRVGESNDQRAMLVGGILVILAGIGFTVYGLLSEEELLEDGTPSVRANAPAAEAATQAANAGNNGSAAAGNAVVCGPTTSVNKLRPASFVESLAIEGKAPQFFPLRDLRMPAAGQKTIVYCLMYSQLDNQTEKAWRNAGMFQDETTVTSPFLRTVTITDQGTYENIFDWHVESVALSMPKATKPIADRDVEPVLVQVPAEPAKAD